MRSILFAFSVTLLMGCGSLTTVMAQSDGFASRAATAQAADAMYRSFAEAYRTLDAEAVRRIYTRDCSYLQPSPISGIENCDGAMVGFRQMFAGAQKARQSLDIAFKIACRRINTDTIVDVGYYRLRSSQGTPPGYGKFVVMMERDTDGALRFAVDGYSMTSAEAFDGLDAPLITALARD